MTSGGSEGSRRLFGLGQRCKWLNCNSVLFSRPSQSGLVSPGQCGIPLLPELGTLCHTGQLWHPLLRLPGPSTLGVLRGAKRQNYINESLDAKLSYSSWGEVGTGSSGKWLNTGGYLRCCIYSGCNDTLLFLSVFCQKQVFCSLFPMLCGGISSSPVLLIFWLIKLFHSSSFLFFFFPPFFLFHWCAVLLQFI